MPKTSRHRSVAGQPVPASTTATANISVLSVCAQVICLTGVTKVGGRFGCRVLESKRRGDAPHVCR